MTNLNHRPDSATFEVWIGCLACYSEGNLVGEWIDALEANEFVPCSRDDHDEYQVFDTEGFNGLLGECNPSEAQDLAERLSEIPAYIELEAVIDYLDNDHSLITDFDLESFEDAYCGQYDSMKDYAYELADEIGFEISNIWPGNCIDWDEAARELENDFWISDHGYVFRNC